MKREKFSREEVAQIFENSWSELVEEYPSERILPTWSSEADVQLHLSHKLLSKLPPESIHIEFRVPIDVKRFFHQLWTEGKVTKRKYIVTDISIINIDPYNLSPLLMAELKFTPFYRSYYPIMHALAMKREGRQKKFVEETKRVLKSDIEHLLGLREYGPSKDEFEKAYLGRERSGQTTKVEKLITILRDFEEKEGIVVSGYLCIIDELYPDLEERLNKEIDKFNPPDQFKLLFEHIDIKESLEENLKKLETT